MTTALIYMMQHIAAAPESAGMLRFPGTSVVAMATPSSMLFAKALYWKEQTCLVKPDRITRREAAGWMSASEKLCLLQSRVVTCSG